MTTRDDEDTAEQVDREARNSTVLEWSVRVGLVAYGFVHLLVAWVALQLALGGSSTAPTGSGALQQLSGGALGKTTLVAMAACFAALVVWQLIAALVGYREQDGWSRHLMRLGALARAVVYGYFAIESAKIAFAGQSGSGGSAQSSTARLMALPAGTLVVGAVGLTIAGIGIGLAVFGWRAGFLGQLDSEARHRQRRTPIVVLGRFGYVVKGIAFVVIGALLVWAAAEHDPRKSGGLDESLHQLLGHSLGTVALVVVAVGIGCFGVYMLVRSRHLDTESLTS